MAATISAWGFFWLPMALSIFCYLFNLTPFAKLNHIFDKKGYNNTKIFSVKIRVTFKLVQIGLFLVRKLGSRPLSQSAFK